jgi:hypothetical protein
VESNYVWHYIRKREKNTPIVLAFFHNFFMKRKKFQSNLFVIVIENNFDCQAEEKMRNQSQASSSMSERCEKTELKYFKRSVSSSSSTRDLNLWTQLRWINEFRPHINDQHYFEIKMCFKRNQKMFIYM